MSFKTSKVIKALYPLMVWFKSKFILTPVNFEKNSLSVSGRFWLPAYSLFSSMFSSQQIIRFVETDNICTQKDDVGLAQMMTVVSERTKTLHYKEKTVG